MYGLDILNPPDLPLMPAQVSIDDIFSRNDGGDMVPNIKIDIVSAQ